MNYSIDIKTLFYLAGAAVANRLKSLMISGKKEIAHQISAVNEMEPLGPETALIQDF